MEENALRNKGVGGARIPDIPPFCAVVAQSLNIKHLKRPPMNLSRDIRREINRAAHSEGERHGRQVRADLIAEAERMLAGGKSAEEILAWLCARDAARARGLTPCSKFAE